MPSAESDPGEALRVLVEVMATLRARCPWDRVQTHASLRRHLLEETYETLEALDAVSGGGAPGGPDGDLCEELGDLLFQVVFHAHLAGETGAFELTDVIDRVRTKLVGRHPAIFAPAADDPGHPDGDPLAWERAKVTEKDRASVMDGIPAALPALAYASKVVGKALAVAPGAIPDPASGATEVHAGGPGAVHDEVAIGRALLELTTAARAAGVDAESALRTAARDLETRVRAAEQVP